jgi:hypothetical protein
VVIKPVTVDERAGLLGDVDEGKLHYWSFGSFLEEN